MKSKQLLAVLILVATLLSLFGDGVVTPVSASRPTPLEVRFSHESGFYNESFDLVLSAPEGATIYYTLNGNPTTQCTRDTAFFTQSTTATDLLYSSPLHVNAGPMVNVFTIRAYATRDGVYSNVVTKNYVKGINVHTRFSKNTLVFVINSDPHGLNNHHDGIFPPGIDRQLFIEDFIRRFGRQPHPHPEQREVVPSSPANFNRRGREAERRIYLEMFDSTGTRYISQEAGMRVKGGWSRAHGQKSLELYARQEDYGVNRFDFPFFHENNLTDGNIINRYRRVRLRNGGSDRGSGFIRDELGHDLLRQAGLPDTQMHVPAAIFLNGSYYGVSWLKTPRTENHFARKWGGVSANFGYLEGSENGYGSNFWESEHPLAVADWRDNVFHYARNGLTDNARWNTFQNRVDIDNFMLYYAFQIYIQNLDWPNHNMEMWRYYPTAAELNDPELHPFLRDGKWRWSPHDIESAWNPWSGSPASINTIHNILHGGSGSNPQWQGTSALLNAVLARPEMRARFANTLVDLIEGVMNPTNVGATLDRLITQIQPEHNFALTMTSVFNEPATVGTYGIHSTVSSVASERNLIRNFANQRPTHMYNHIRTTLGPQFSQWDRYAVTVTTSEGGKAVMNSRHVEELQNATGNYYSGTSIDITAKPYPGYTFSHWVIDDAEQRGTDVITVGSQVNVQAHFVKSPEMTLYISAVKSTAFNSQAADWFEIYNPSDETLSTKGLFLSDSNNDFYKFQIPATNIRPGETFRFITNGNAVDSVKKRSRVNFNIGFDENLRLTDARGNVLSLVTTTIIGQDEVLRRRSNGQNVVTKIDEQPLPVCDVCKFILPCPCPPPPVLVPVRLAAFDATTRGFYRSSVINLTGNGRHSVTLTIPNMASLSSLALLADGANFDYPGGFVAATRAPSNYASAQVSFENITINGNPIRNTFNRSLLGTDSNNDLGYVRASLWNAYGSRFLNTTDVTEVTMGDGGVAFRLPSGEPIHTITLEFVVRNVW